MEDKITKIPLEKYFLVPCRCAMDGNKSSKIPKGFCDTVIGTEPYAKALTKMKSMHEKSQCHTFDRLNFRAQMGRGCSTVDQDPKALEEAVEWYFKI